MGIVAFFFVCRYRAVERWEIMGWLELQELVLVLVVVVDVVVVAVASKRKGFKEKKKKKKLPGRVAEYGGESAMPASRLRLACRLPNFRFTRHHTKHCYRSLAVATLFDSTRLALLCSFLYFQREVLSGTLHSCVQRNIDSIGDELL